MDRSAEATKIALPKMAELVAERIRGQIARGEFKSGDSLPSETVLMEQFGVARPTMREAIRILESESLISTRRGSQSGPKVREVDASVLGRRVGLMLQMTGTTWNDLFEAQFALEPPAVALAAARRTADDVATLRELVGSLRELSDLQDVLDVVAAFHLALVRASKNRTLTMVAEMLHSLTLEIYRGQASLLRPIGEKIRDSTIELFTLVTDKIEAGDADGAEEVWGNERSALRKALDRYARERGISIYHG